MLLIPIGTAALVAAVLGTTTPAPEQPAVVEAIAVEVPADVDHAPLDELLRRYVDEAKSLLD